jgi:hypothetical protein
MNALPIPNLLTFTRPDALALPIAEPDQDVVASGTVTAVDQDAPTVFSSADDMDFDIVSTRR